MRILYLSLSYVPSRRASGVHVMKMCAALARGGHEVTLVTKGNPSRQEEGVEDDFAFYGVEPGFEIVKLPRPGFKGGGLIYLWAMDRLLARIGREVDLVYSRDLAGAWLAARRRLPLVFEAHGLPKGPLSRRLHRSVFAASSFRRLVVISRALRERFRRLDLLPGRDRVLVAHDAADPGRPVAHDERERERLRIGYVGHLYPGRGVEVVLALAERLPGCDFHLIGGRENDLARWRSGSLPHNLSFCGFLPPGELAGRYAGFDVLLMPYQRRVIVASGKTDTSSWMSPMKMFEYMAAGRAIVSSDLPVLGEVLENEGNALLVPPDDLDAWEGAVRRLVDDEALRRRLGERARADLLAGYTWDARAARVLDGL